MMYYSMHGIMCWDALQDAWYSHCINHNFTPIRSLFPDYLSLSCVTYLLCDIIAQLHLRHMGDVFLMSMSVI